MNAITAGDLEQVLADVSGAGTYGCFEYQGISVGLHTDEPAQLDWFSAFFGGYFTVTQNRQTDAVVCSSQDAALVERLKECATSHGRPRSANEIEYELDADHRIIVSRETDAAKGGVAENCFVLSRPGRTVLVAAPGPLEERRKTVKRSLRNMMKLLFMEKGWLPFHSAACVWDGTGIVILGAKFAGKTSTLVNLLARPGAGLVTNDNLFLRARGAVVEGCGFPNNAGLRVGALVAYPRLMQWIEAPDSFHPRIDAATFRDIVATTPANELGGRSEKIVLLSSELAEQFGVPIQHRATIELCLVVQFDPSLEESRLTPMTSQQVRECLVANFRSLGREKQDFLQDFFDFDDAALHAGFDTLLEQFTTTVTVRALHQNATTNEHSAELIRRLTLQRE